MPDKTLLEKLLDGETPRVNYSEIHGVLLNEAKCQQGQPDGAMRAWKHPLVSGVLHVRDCLSQHMYSKEVAKVGNYLKEIEKAGGL